jgi:DNA-binding NarL/FixJ family response regulator
MAASALRTLASSAPGGTVVGQFRLASYRALRRLMRRIAGALPAAAAGAAIEAPAALSRLSTREREIVTLLLAGDRVPAIAESLHLAQSTIRNHLASVFRKLRVSSQQELISLLRKRD